MFDDFKYDYEFYELDTNSLVSDSIVQNWTQSAIDCYQINCDCSKCQIALGGYSFKCKMKNIVEILLKTKGIPYNNIFENFEQEVA